MGKFIDGKIKELTISSNNITSEYIQSINNTELKVLRELKDFDRFLYEFRLITTNIERYRNYLLHEIDNNILQYKSKINHMIIEKASYEKRISFLKAKNQNNILMNDSQTIQNNNQDSKDLLSHYYVNNIDKKDIYKYQNIIDLIKKNIDNYNAIIEEEKKKKASIDRKTHQMLIDEFKALNFGNIIKLKDIFTNPITPTEKAIHDIMQTKQGYDDICDILRKVEILEEKKKNIKVTFDLSNIELSFNSISYLNNEFNINTSFNSFNEEKLLHIKKVINEKICELLKLQELMLKFDPRRFANIKNKSKNNSINFALNLIEHMNLDSLPNISSDYHQAVFIINYLLSYEDEIGLGKLFSKSKKQKELEYHSKLKEKSMIIIETSEQYIKELYRKVIYKTYSKFDNQKEDINYLSTNYVNYLDEINSFINNLERINRVLEETFNELNTRKSNYDNEIANKKKYLYLKADIVSEGQDLKTDSNLYSIYESAYRKITIGETDDSVCEELNVSKIRPKITNKPETKRFIKYL